MQDENFVKFKKILPSLQSNILLKNHTTFHIGGPAKYFLLAENKAQILKALTLAKALHVPFFILGGGSNILASDKGFRGLVIKIQNKNHAFEIKKGNIIKVPAGVEVGELVKFSCEHALEGLAWAGGLPGTFGGAVRGNAGAFGGETKDSILEVEALDKNLKVRNLSNKQCQFSYRSSIFKEKNWIVLSATLQFKQGDKKNLLRLAQANMQYRQDRHPLDLPNAGSIFKNCDLKYFSEKLQKELAAVVKKDPFPVVPVAYLIAQLGLKGKKFGGAQISDKHPNFIVNIENAKARDVLKVIDFNKENVRKNYGVDLEQEVQFLEN